MYLISRPSTQKMLWVMLFVTLLMSCTKKETQFFLFKRYDPKTDNWNYYKANLYNPSQIEEINVIPCSEDKRDQPFWSPNGNYYVCSANYIQPLRIYDIHNVITAKIDQGNPEDPNVWYVSGWSPDSQYVSVIKLRSLEKPYYSFAVMKYDGTELLQLNKQSMPTIDNGEWSPNGELIAHQIYTDGKASMVLFQLSGKEVLRFDMPEYINSPMLDIKWSPDSKKIAFHTYYNIEMDSKLYVFEIANEKLTDIIPDKSICIVNIADWSPNSERVLFDAIACENHLSEDRLHYSINVDGSELKPINGNNVSDLRWTLDGKTIIVDKYEEGQGVGIYLMNIDGSDQRKLVDNAYFVSWIKP